MRQAKLMISMSVVALLGATTFGIGASVTSRPTMMTERDYEALKIAIAIDADDGMAMCNSFPGNGRLACQSEVRAERAVQLAELEMRYRGTYEAARDVRMVRIRANYEKARTQCFGLSGYERDTCIVRAHAEKARALMAVKAEA